MRGKVPSYSNYPANPNKVCAAPAALPLCLLYWENKLHSPGFAHSSPQLPMSHVAHSKPTSILNLYEKTLRSRLPCAAEQPKATPGGAVGWAHDG